MNASRNSPLIGQAAFTRMAVAGTNLTPLGQELLKRAAANPDDAHTLLDLSTVLLLTGNRELSLQMQAQALQIQQLYRLPMHQQRPALRLLALMTPGDMMANTPLEFLLEKSDVELTLLYIGQNLPLPEALPEHDVLFVAIGESERNLDTLRRLQDVLADWPHPIVNRPENIARLARDDVWNALHDAPGVLIPQTFRVSRADLEEIARTRQSLSGLLGDTDFPLIARPVDSHAGKGLVKLSVINELEDYLPTLPDAQEFFLSPYVDYRQDDGLFRKYRIALIGGQPYLAHLAISGHWIVHYVNAEMANNAERRAEEAYAMSHFDSGFARRHRAALAAIHQRMGLDYLGLDCSETADGKLLIFEVDTSMVVHAMDSPEVFPYKQPQMRKLFAAFRQLLLDRAQPGGN